MNYIKQILLAATVTVLLYSCAPADGNFPGSEYMPDMAHSLTLESNTYSAYYYNTWDSASTISLADLTYPRTTVSGTMPRGYAGVYFADGTEASDSILTRMSGADNTNAVATPLNGFVPYYYEDTEDERLRATAEIVANPFPITENGLERGKNLYEIFCAICHGEKGNGLGYIYDPDQNPNAVYPAAPANMLNDEFSAASNGRYYHAIMYGKNVMGAYKDKMNYEERWQVIHWIRALQAQDKGLVYNSMENTLNPEFGTPIQELGPVAFKVAREASDTQVPSGMPLDQSMREFDNQNEVSGASLKKDVPPMPKVSSAESTSDTEAPMTTSGKDTHKK